MHYHDEVEDRVKKFSAGGRSGDQRGHRGSQSRTGRGAQAEHPAAAARISVRDRRVRLLWCD